MGNINSGRIVLGGLAAGVVLNIGEFVLNEVVMKKQMTDFFTRHNFPAEPGGFFIPFAVALTFVLGIVMVWTYALIRPRVGPGPKAAVYVALIAWFGIYVYTGLINGVLFAIPLITTLAVVIAWGLVEYILASLVGAWLYKET